MASQQSMSTIVEEFATTISTTALVLADGDVGSITAAQVQQADECWIQVLSGQLRYTTDGSTPDGTTGWLQSAADGKVPVAGNRVLNKLQFYGDADSDAVINVGLYKWG